MARARRRDQTAYLAHKGIPTPRPRHPPLPQTKLPPPRAGGRSRAHARVGACGGEQAELQSGGEGVASLSPFYANALGVEPGLLRQVAPPHPPSGTKWTRRVPHPVLIGHAASLSQVAEATAALSARRMAVFAPRTAQWRKSLVPGGQARELHVAFMSSDLSGHIVGRDPALALNSSLGKLNPLVLSGHAASLAPY